MTMMKVKIIFVHGYMNLFLHCPYFWYYPVSTIFFHVIILTQWLIEFTAMLFYWLKIRMRRGSLKFFRLRLRYLPFSDTSLTLELWPSLPNCLYLPLPVSFTSTSAQQSINGVFVGIPFLPEDCRRGKCWSRCKISGFSCHRITGMFGTLIALFLNSK